MAYNVTIVIASAAFFILFFIFILHTIVPMHLFSSSILPINFMVIMEQFFLSFANETLKIQVEYLLPCETASTFVQSAAQYLKDFCYS